MKIALINGSPKAKESASLCLFQDLKPLIEKEDNIITEFTFRKPHLSLNEMSDLRDFDVLIFAFPLYVDGIPSHLLRCLTQLETFFSSIKDKNIMTYSIVNCGFYEGLQCRLALQMMENWSIKAGLRWGQGVGIGAGGMLLSTKNVPLGKGPKKNLKEVLVKLSSNILSLYSAESLFISRNFPRVLYKLGAEMGWRKQIKANGLTRKDLSLRK